MSVLTYYVLFIIQLVLLYSDMLRINIHSFSYIYGTMPVDTCGNGGGFVFDCRYINNPAKIEHLFYYCGQDEPVIKYLDEDDLMIRFLKNTFEIVSDAVQVYLQRGFKDLMISFGCTGGQHRSVYAAERLKEFLESNFQDDVIVSLKHNMKDKWIRK